ncbi:MAG: S46 family peptidase [Proteobacteria bacterium]|nr:S46 family peptidase [Pseudomonadota bacterium]
MPQQLGDHADTLRSLGLELDVENLTDPLSPTLAAIVSLGGCSASFVSPDGLVITNYHCVQGALQYHSTPEDNLVETGFLAATRADEKWNGPSARVYVTQGFSKVTDRVLGGLDQISDDRKRYDEIDARKKKLVAECEKNRPHMRCTVSSYFRGAEFYLIERLQIRDVRLVYAPHRGIGWYGGDDDNWMWPRHTGDYSFYRAYVGKDGQPADYSKDNVPYRPKHWLKVASKPLRKGDLVMVAGYPVRTQRHQTAAEVKEAVEWSYPRRIAMFDEYLAKLHEVKKIDKETEIKATMWIFGLENVVKNHRGMMEGLVKGGLAAARSKLQQDLTAWIKADPARRDKYGTVLAEMEALDADRKKTRDRDADLGSIFFVAMFRSADTLVRMAEERTKPDAKREERYQERNWKRIEAGLRTLERHYNRHLDRAMLTLTLQRAARHPQRNGDWLKIILGEGPYDNASIERTVNRLYEETKLEDTETRVALFTKATTEELEASKDPFIALAIAMRPLFKKFEEREKRYTGAMSLLKPRYIAALREFSRGSIAPDANGTLRITYGTVRGYRPRPSAEVYEPFTVVSQMAQKHTGKEPFAAPRALLDAVTAKRFGRYVASDVGEVPVNFLADLDTTGGNSGSATINSRGELVGLLFDGNYESMASDWLFIPELTRSIHLDIRYALWIMDAVDRAHHLLREMGVAPAFAAE